MTAQAKMKSDFLRLPEAGWDIQSCDCRLGFRHIEQGTVDLVVADPPYNFGEDYGDGGRGDKLKPGDFECFMVNWLAGAVDILAQGGALWVVIPDEWASGVDWECRDILHLIRRNWVVWTYRFGQNTDGKFIRGKVHCLYFTKGKPKTWNPDAVLVDSDRATKYNDPRTQNKKTGTAGKRLPLDVWGWAGDDKENWGRVQGNNAERNPDHPNQLPEMLVARIVKACSNPGDLVVDPFTGTGTTGTVAVALGRRFIGFEINPTFAENARKRIEAGPVREL